MNTKIKNLMTIVGMLLLCAIFASAADIEEQAPVLIEPDNTCSAAGLLLFVEPYGGCNFYCPWCPGTLYSCDSAGSCC